MQISMHNVLEWIKELLGRLLDLMGDIGFMGFEAFANANLVGIASQSVRITWIQVSLMQRRDFLLLIPLRVWLRSLKAVLMACAALAWKAGHSSSNTTRNARSILARIGESSCSFQSKSTLVAPFFFCEKNPSQALAWVLRCKFNTGS